jgi:pyruvate/2-oxoglutarate dehydrogenase complex dihydrolipoamide acyltransferase (E2) component
MRYPVSMPIVDIAVPQMGEGLQEVLVVALARQTGDRVRRDDVLYSMETDKATLDVESPCDGVLTQWLAAPGDTLPIGATIARIETGESETAAEGPSDLRAIPPRTRAYAREVGLSDSELAQVRSAGAKLMPGDIDAFLEVRRKASVAPAGEFSERPLSHQDRTFLFRLKRSASIVIPAVAKRQMDWAPIRTYTDARKADATPTAPSAFLTVAWCVARAVREHPKFRSTLIGEEVVREYAHLNLGIAVAVPSGELTIAAIPRADTLDFDTFIPDAQERIKAARGGDDQAADSVSLILTYLGPYEITDAVPVLVAPAVAVLFIGSTFESGGKLVVNLVLTFDHRLIHGVEAAEFLRSIVQNAAALAETAG